MQFAVQERDVFVFLLVKRIYLPWYEENKQISSKR